MQFDFGGASGGVKRALISGCPMGRVSPKTNQRSLGNTKPNGSGLFVG